MSRTPASEQSADSRHLGPAKAASTLTEWAQQYSVEANPLGRGSFASVYKGVNRETHEPVAIKVMTKARLGERALNMLAAEINILRTLEHPNVVCLRDSHTTERRILIVLEFCGGGDLGQFIQARGPSPERTARHFMLQLAAGLAFLRSRRLIHRDIKPQNLLLSENSSRASLKIADFGLARHLPQGSLAESVLGSPLYMAPEVLNNRAYDAKADLWSAGAVLYELVTAKHPFGGANQTELINNIRRNKPRLPAGVTLSHACVELLGMLLVPRPSERASLQTFLLCDFLNPANASMHKSPPHGRESGSVSGVAGVNTNESASRPGRPVDQSAPHEQPSNQSANPSLERSSSPDDRLAARPSRDRSDVESSRPSARAHVGHGREDTAERSQRSLSAPKVAPASVPALCRAAVGDTKLPGDKLNTASSGSAGGRRTLARLGTTSGAGRREDDQAEEQVSKNQVSGDPVGGRDGQWGWDWGGKGVMGIGDEGPLPALPALPFALGPFDVPSSSAEAGVVADERKGGGGGGGGGCGGGFEMPHEFGFDLAFARSPARDRSPPARPVAVRERRSLSVDDVPTTGPRERAAGPDTSRRKRNDAGAGAVPAAAPTVAAAPPRPSPARRRSQSFSVQDAPSGRPRLERANTYSEASNARVPPAAAHIRRPDPVFYLGKGGSVPGTNASPAHTRQPAPVRRSSSERQSSLHDAGALTPPSPAYYASDTGDFGGGGDDDSFGGGGGAGGAAGVDGGGASPYSVSPRDAGGQVSPAHQAHPSTLLSGGHQLAVAPSSWMEGCQQQQQSATPADGGVPMLVKYPSLRGGGGGGGDSLLTIPEDSTGFVLVTRPSSISCEHGTGCECWAWSVAGGGGCGGGGGGGGVGPLGAGISVRSPSASYLSAANPYAGPGKSAAAASAERRSGAGAFLGSVGSIWNSAVNTFRGVAGAHGRRSSWPARRSGAAGPQQGGALGSVSPPTAAVPAGVSAAGVSGALSPREQLSPLSAQYRKMGTTVGSPSGSAGGSRSGSSSGSRGGGVGSAGGAGRGGGRNYTSQHGAAAQQAVDSGDGAYRADAQAPLHHGGGLLASPGDEATRRQPPPTQSGNRPYHHHQHQRRHSEPISRQSYPCGVERGGSGSGAGTGNSCIWTSAEIVESQRVQAAAARAEVVGKRSILIVTLADKTAQEAMSLALESPRDGHGRVPGTGTGVGGGGGADVPAGGPAYARRRHDMLTEALSLYVKALAILQGVLPSVLVECEGVPTEGLAAWNPMSAEPSYPGQHQHQQKVGRPSPPSPALLAQRAALVTKASWLKELFSQTLQRAEHCHCRAQASPPASTAAATSSKESAADGGGGGGCTTGSNSSSSSSAGPGAPWATLGGGVALPSDVAAAAVFRSAMEHGQEAAVCYLLGRSDAAVTHYVRACALLQLLALEPEMGCAREEGLRGGGEGGFDGGQEKFTLRAQKQQQQQSGGWQAQLLKMAEGFAQRVETISRSGGEGGAVGGSGDTGYCI